MGTAMQPVLRPFAKLLELNTDLALNCLDGLSDEDAAARPLPDANSIAFLVIHLADARYSIATLLGCPNDGALAEYAHARSIDDVPSLPGVEELREIWRAASRHVSACFERVGGDKLREPAGQKFPIDDESVLGAVAFLVQHDSYHLGQLSLLRKGLGRGPMSYRRDRAIRPEHPAPPSKELETAAEPVLETERLTLRRLRKDDAPFIRGLLNEPSFLEFVGDKGVRTEADARRYIATGPQASYAQHGFGLYLTSLKSDGTPIGICGLLKRDVLEDADVGFALRPQFWSQGFTSEAASAVLEYGRREFGLKRVLAVTSPGNERSIRVLTRLGLRFERMVRLAEDEDEIQLFASSG